MPYKVKEAQAAGGHRPRRSDHGVARRDDERRVPQRGQEGRATRRSRNRRRRSSDATPPASAGFELLRPGEAVPAAHFVDQNGTPRDFSSFKGSTVVLTFIYTRCPMPTFCPLMDRALRDDSEEREGATPALQGPRAAGQRQLRPAHGYAAGPQAAREDARRRPRGVDVPHGQARRHRSVRRALRRVGLARDERSEGHHAHAADRDRRRGRQAASRSTPATSGRRTRSLPTYASRKKGYGPLFTAHERRLIGRLRTPTRRAALPQSPAVQRGAARTRHAPQLSRRRPPRERALPRGGAVRGGRPRAARRFRRSC